MQAARVVHALKANIQLIYSSTLAVSVAFARNRTITANKPEIAFAHIWTLASAVNATLIANRNALRLATVIVYCCVGAFIAIGAFALKSIRQIDALFC
jgi:hypothetical protein